MSWDLVDVDGWGDGSALQGHASAAPGSLQALTVEFKFNQSLRSVRLSRSLRTLSFALPYLARDVVNPGGLDGCGGGSALQGDIVLCDHFPQSLEAATLSSGLQT